MSDNRSKRWRPSNAVKKRYGDVSDMWLWRRNKDDSGFPKPVVIAGRKFWDESELDAWDAEQAAKRAGKAA